MKDSLRQIIFWLSLFFACSLQAVEPAVEYFRWKYDTTGQENPPEFLYANMGIFEKKDGVYTLVGYVSEYQGADNQTPGFIGTAILNERPATIVADWQDSAYSFQLELFNADEESMGYVGMMVSYEDLKYARYTGDDPSSYTWNAIGPAPVPEPTSGMMVLVGMALLALRRKRQAA